MSVLILRTARSLADAVSGWKARGESVGVVPTMGALHNGHLSLVRAAKAGCDRVIVTIFVNPAQFGSADDLALYPRTEASDVRHLEPLGVDAIFAPSVAQVYPPGFATTVRVGTLTVMMEGAHRPGHFDGVTTVVAKLFAMTRAERAYFGQKDWQQLCIVRRMVSDLDMTVDVIGVDTVRETDGLAMSSRNGRLDAVSRRAAPALYRALEGVAQAVRQGEPAARALDAARAAILAAGFSEVGYVDLRDAETLEPANGIDRPARVLAAAHIGGVRLIDNIPA